MQISPRYGDEPLIRMGSLVDDPAVPLLRQRTRLGALLSTLDDEQWAAPTRCEAWSVQDVIAHLTTTNQFWALSITSGLDGTPTRILAGFDPVATPAALVDAVRSRTPAETLDGFLASNDALAATVTGLDADGWSRPAEAPPGHLAISLVALHALWDAWIHERDIALPLGLAAVEEADEIAGSLIYVAALGPAFDASRGATRTGTLVVEASDPDVRVVVDVGPTIVLGDRRCDTDQDSDAVTLTGDAIELVEALSFRAPLASDLADDQRWVLGNLGEVFDQAP